MKLCHSLLLGSCLISLFCYSSASNSVSLPPISQNSPTAALENKYRKNTKHFSKFEESVIMSPSSNSDQKILASQGATKAAVELPAFVKLIFGAGGIYAAFLYYGTLQEEVFHYKAADGTKFKAAWFLQTLEALANVVIGGIGLKLLGGTKLDTPIQKLFALAGSTQVCAKAFTSLSLANSVSFPVVTLAKSGKMVPVMIGSLLLGGSKYTLREYLSVAAIIVGTCVVSMGNKKSGPASSIIGISFIVLSLVCDGITGGLQNRVKKVTKEQNIKIKPYDMMFWTNLYMSITAAIVSLALGELQSGAKFCLENPVVLQNILRFALCSAIGQSFIFYTIANFDSLTCTTITTTRKVFSVLLSIFLNGHAMSSVGWGGLALASAGILSELADKGGKGHGEEKVKTPEEATASKQNNGKTKAL